MSEQRFIDIETKILHQERLLEELHQALYQQQAIIDKLEKKLSQIIEMAQSDLDIRAANEKPPHY